MARDVTEQLTKYLTDAHSIEEQALQQLRSAPDLAGEPKAVKEDGEVVRIFLKLQPKAATALERRLASRPRKSPTSGASTPGKPGGILCEPAARVHPMTGVTSC